MRREATAGEQRKRGRGRKRWRRQVEVRQCSGVDCLKRRLQRPAKEKGGRKGSRQVMGGRVGGGTGEKADT